MSGKTLPTSASTASPFRRQLGSSFQALITSKCLIRRIPISEDRFIAIGPIVRGLVLVVWTERDGDTVRIITPRWASNRERALYRNFLENLK